MSLLSKTTDSDNCSYCFYLVETVSLSLYPLVCFFISSLLLSNRLFPIFLPSLPTCPSTHLFFYRSELPDSSSHSCCSRCWCPQRHERPQSELPHQSQVKNKHTTVATVRSFGLHRNIHTDVDKSAVPQFSLPLSPHRSITKTVVNAEIRKEIGENQKVHVYSSIHLLIFHLSIHFSSPSIIFLNTMKTPNRLSLWNEPGFIPYFSYCQ